MEEKETMIQIDNVSKVYRLGEIGGTTLRESFQRLGAKIRHKEDPTKKIGAKNYNKGEKFKALDNINLTIKKGERVGIIGHNGAGKSTLLKLICRVTAPTTGEIGLNGRVTSMLEVGTGFHPELTGRENIYMNGAILGMTKKVIDAVIEDIIDFSEVREFIDTPVKRYSSGMYVKLAFSVAAHLKSEIMIMDEVLAVGDMAFQNKCLTKMRDVSEQQDRTILYVSHNMNTIRKLCDRVIVLQTGKIVYDGEVQKGINLYMNGSDSSIPEVSLVDKKRFGAITNSATLIKASFLDKNNCVFVAPEKVFVQLIIRTRERLDGCKIRINIFSSSENPVSSSTLPLGELFENKDYCVKLMIDTTLLAPGSYWLNFAIIFKDNCDNDTFADYVNKAICFEYYDDNYKGWNNIWWGYIKNFPITILAKKEY